MIYKVELVNQSSLQNSPSIIEIYNANTFIISPRLTMEINKAGSFDFTIPPDNPGYDEIKLMSSTVCVYENNVMIWSGRPIQIDTDFYNRKKVTCEGALAYFNDVMLPTKEYKKTYANTFFEDIISRYNARVAGGLELSNSSFRKFVVSYDGSDLEVDPNHKVKLWRKTDYDAAIDCLEDMLLNAEGGYFLVDHNPQHNFINNSSAAFNRIRYVRKINRAASQTIEFGENLTDFTKTDDATEIYTYLVPVCHYNDKTYTLKNWVPELDNNDTIEYTNAEYIGGSTGEMRHSPLYNKYGRLEKVVEYDMVSNLVDTSNLKGNEKTNAELENQEIIDATKLYMYQATMRKCDELQYDEMTLEVTAADLKNISPNSNIDNFKLGTLVDVTSSPHNLNITLPVSKIEMDLDTAIKKITIGMEKKRELTEIYKPKKKRLDPTNKHTTTDTMDPFSHVDVTDNFGLKQPIRLDVKGVGIGWVGSKINYNGYKFTVTYDDGSTKVLDKNEYNVQTGYRNDGSTGNTIGFQDYTDIEGITHSWLPTRFLINPAEGTIITQDLVIVTYNETGIKDILNLYYAVADQDHFEDSESIVRCTAIYSENGATVTRQFAYKIMLLSDLPYKLMVNVWGTHNGLHSISARYSSPTTDYLCCSISAMCQMRIVYESMFPIYYEEGMYAYTASPSFSWFYQSWTDPYSQLGTILRIYDISKKYMSSNRITCRSTAAFDMDVAGAMSRDIYTFPDASKWAYARGSGTYSLSNDRATMNPRYVLQGMTYESAYNVLYNDIRPNGNSFVATPQGASDLAFTGAYPAGLSSGASTNTIPPHYKQLVGYNGYQTFSDGYGLNHTYYQLFNGDTTIEQSKKYSDNAFDFTMWLTKDGVMGGGNYWYSIEYNDSPAFGSYDEWGDYIISQGSPW